MNQPEADNITQKSAQGHIAGIVNNKIDTQTQYKTIKIIQTNERG